MSDERWPNGLRKIPPQMCPKCGYVVSAASATDGSDDKPEPGNGVFCLNCGELAIFDDFMRLRPPTPTELADPELQHEAAHMKRAAIMKQGKDLRKNRGGRA